MEHFHIKVKVFPGSAEETVIRADNAWRVYLREPPKEGLANKRLLEVLRRELEPKPKILRIVGGEHSPSKIIEIEY
jgi:uncharacterized protein YggU (UPF0235/DUF167 family)